MVTSIINAVVGGNAAKSAAREQEAAAQQATNAEQAQYQQTREDVAKQQTANTGYLNPYMQTGSNATGELNYLLGLGGSDTSNGSLGGAGSLGQSFTMADYQADPGYAFRLQQGQQALSRAQAAGGQYFSGAGIKALTDYNQNSASQEYQNAYNRYVQNQNNLYSKLSGTAQQGLSAANSLGQLNSNLTTNQATQGGQTAANVGQNYIGAGNAEAAGTVGAANSYTTGLSALFGGSANPFNTPSGTGTGLGGSGAASSSGGVDLGQSLPWLMELNMPLDPSIILAAGNIPQNALNAQQQAFNLSQAQINAPYKTAQDQATLAQTQQQTQNAQLTNQTNQLALASAKLSAVGGLMNGVTDQDSYTAHLQAGVQSGLIPPQYAQTHAVYDPQMLEGYKDTLSQQKAQLDRQVQEANLAKTQAETKQINMQTGVLPNVGVPNTQAPTNVILPADMGTQVAEHFGMKPEEIVQSPLLVRAQRMLDGLEDPTKPTERSDKLGIAAANLAKTIDPSFDQTVYQTRQNTVKAYSPQGEAGQDYKAINTIAGHVDELAKKYQALGNKSEEGTVFAPLQNYIGNELTATQHPGALRQFDATRAKLADEISKFYVKGGGTGTERGANKEDYAQSDSPETQSGMLGTAADLAISKLEALEQSRVSGYGKSVPVNTLIAPDTLQTLAKYASPEGKVKLAKLAQASGVIPAQGTVQGASESAAPGSANAALIQQATGRVSVPALQQKVQLAKQAGYSDAEIQQYLAGQK